MIALVEFLLVLFAEIFFGRLLYFSQKTFEASKATSNRETPSDSTNYDTKVASHVLDSLKETCFSRVAGSSNDNEEESLETNPIIRDKRAKIAKSTEMIKKLAKQAILHKRNKNTEEYDKAIQKITAFKNLIGWELSRIDDIKKGERMKMKVGENGNEGRETGSIFDGNKNNREETKWTSINKGENDIGNEKQEPNREEIGTSCGLKKENEENKPNSVHPGEVFKFKMLGMILYYVRNSKEPFKG